MHLRSTFGTIVCHILTPNSTNNDSNSHSALSRTDAHSASPEASITLSSGLSNESLALNLCAQIDSSTTSVSINYQQALVGTYWTLPDCINSTLNILNFRVSHFIITKVDALPSVLQIFTLAYCKFAPSASLAAKGFTSDGQVRWEDWWDQWPIIATVSVTNTNLAGNLPASLPSLLSYLTISNNPNIVGSIPATMFAGYLPPANRRFTAEFQSNSLTGYIPSNLFDPLGNQSMVGFSFKASSNLLSGSIPSGLLAPFQSMVTLELSLSNNKITGSVPRLPEGLLAPSSSNGGDLILALNGNQLTGSLPTDLFSSIGRIRFLSATLANNNLSSTLPPSLFRNVSISSTAQILINLQENEITGSIPPTLLTSVLSTQNQSLAALTLRLSENKLNGTIPSRLFKTLSTTSSDIFYVTKSLTLDVSNNQLIGSIPFELFDGTLQSDPSAYLSFDNNFLSGTIPDIASAFDNSANGQLQFYALNNSLTGDAPTECNSIAFVEYQLASNCLNGSITPPLPNSCTSLNLDVGLNARLSGSIPPELFNVLGLTFFAPNTNLSGLIPPYLTSAGFAFINLISTPIDFCSHPLNVSAPNFYVPTGCKLDYTTACDCPGNYTGCSIQCRSAPSPVPLASPTPPAGCDPKTRPSPEFFCVNSTWTATSTSSPTLTIPSGAGVIVVEGNVSSSTIVINGIGSKIVIGGCSTNLSTIIIELSPEEVKQLQSTKSLQDLVTLSNASQPCSSDLNSVVLTTRTKGCRKVSTEKVVSESGHTLSALFVVNSSSCNTWWIILVSVVVVVIIVGVIVAAIAGVLWKRHVEKKDFDRLEQSTEKKG